eukprot:g5260.t1
MQGTYKIIAEGLSFVSVRGQADQQRDVTAAGGGVISADIRTIVHACLSPVSLNHIVSDVRVYTASPARLAVPPAAVLSAGDRWQSTTSPQGPWVKRLTTGIDMCQRHQNAVMLIDMPQPHEINECLDHIDEKSEDIMAALAGSNSLVLCNTSHAPYPAMVEADGGYVMRTPVCDDIGASIRKALTSWHWYDCDMASAFSTYFGYTTVQASLTVSVVIPLTGGALATGKPFATSPSISSGSVVFSKSAGGLCFDTAPGQWSIGFLLRHDNEFPELGWCPLAHEPRDLARLTNCVIATTQDEQALAYFEYTRTRMRTKDQASQFMRQLAQVADVCIRNIENKFGIFSQDAMHRPQLGCGLARHASVGLVTQ